MSGGCASMAVAHATGLAARRHPRARPPLALRPLQQKANGSLLSHEPLRLGPAAKSAE